MKYQYKKVDAFTSETSAGNPAACIYLKEDEQLTHEQMLEIASQHAGFVSEMAFCKPLKNQDAAYEVKYYSSECEVDFCGHGTIACMYSLIKYTPELLEKDEIAIVTKKGMLHVYNEIATQDAVFISAPKPTYIGTDLTKEKIAKALKISQTKITDTYPIDLINAGLRTLIVPIASLASEIGMLPDRQELEDFVNQHGIDIILVFSKEVQDCQHIIHSRVFAPKFGYLEDPATGSGNSAMAYYMLKNNMWNGESASIEQGDKKGAFNIVKIKTIDENTQKRVLFGGKATVRIDGHYII